MYSTILTAALIAFLSTTSALPYKVTRAVKYSTTGRLNPTYTKDQLNELKLALSTVDRLSIVKSFGSLYDYFKFDFSPAANKDPVAGVGQGGQGDLAYVDNFPVLLNLGVSLSMGFMKPCKSAPEPSNKLMKLLNATTEGMNTPHTHNRASEFLLLVKGGNVHTSFVQESGLDTPIETTLSLYQGAILPMGSIHYEFNDNCEPAAFVAAFSDEDPYIYIWSEQNGAEFLRRGSGDRGSGSRVSKVPRWCKHCQI